MKHVVTVMAGVVFVSAMGHAVAAEPSPARTGSSIDLLVLGEAKVSRVQILVEIDGKPIDKVWDETFRRIHGFFDRNGDGVLDEKESTHLPSPRTLRLAMGSGFTPPVGSAPAFGDMDQNGDGKVTVEELSRFYRRAGLGNTYIGVGRLPTSKELTESLLKNLDTDGDGKVSEKEWKAAAESLRKLDKNDDELIGVGELVAKASFPGAAGTTLLKAGVADDLRVMLLPDDEANTDWAAALLRRRDRDRDGFLCQAEAGLDAALFARLDTNKDGKLSQEELAGLRKAEPDARWLVKLGEKALPGERFAFKGDTRVEGWLTEGHMPDAIASARRQLTGQFEKGPDATPGRRGRARGDLDWLTPIADRNGDGTLDDKELDQWLDLQQQIGQGQVLLTILDGGVDLFDLLDTNHDGALSVRELRGAWSRLGEVGCLTDGQFDRAKIPHVLLATASRGYPKSFATDPRRGPAWFRAMDRNGDGDVSRREFTGPPEVFDKLDLDKDGLLDPDEAGKAADNK